MHVAVGRRLPPPANAAGPVSLQLSPNGQQYSHAGGFMYYDEPVHARPPRSGRKRAAP